MLSLIDMLKKFIRESTVPVLSTAVLLAILILMFEPFDLIDLLIAPINAEPLLSGHLMNHFDTNHFDTNHFDTNHDRFF